MALGPYERMERRRREERYREAAEEYKELLARISVDTDEVELIPMDRTDELWPRFVEKLKAANKDSRTWSSMEIDLVQNRVEELNPIAAGMRVVWFTQLQVGDAIAFEVPASPLLNAALSQLVVDTNDLMLATPDLASGLCLQWNYIGRDHEYELATWGRFSEHPPVSLPA
jgi:hypothetical protein